MAATQKELAELLHVSSMTVSRALRDSPLVRADLRKTIQETASQHGYSLEAHFGARALRLQGTSQQPRTNVICALVAEADVPQGFGGRLLKGIGDAADDRQAEVITVPRFRGTLPLMVQRKQVDGVIWSLGDLDLVGGRATCPVPWVALMYEVPGADLVSVDNQGGGQMLGQTLAQAGHRRVAFLGPETNLSRQRLAGLEASLAQVGGGIPGWAKLVEPFACNLESTQALIDRLLDGQGRLPARQRVTAIAAYNDYMAVVAMQRLAEYGLSVPDDFSLTGFDGSPPPGYHGPELTTAAIDLEELGTEAVRLLDWRIKHPQAGKRRVILETRLIEGQTVRRNAHEVAAGSKDR